MATETAPRLTPVEQEVLERPAPRRELAPSERPPARRRRAVGVSLLALAAYAAYAVFVTWPLATDPTGLLAGASVGPDRGGTTAQMAYLLSHHLTPFLPATLHGINAPEGFPLPWVVNWVGAPATALVWGLSLAFGAVGGENALLWLSFVGSAMAMFWLCRRLFDHSPSAFLAGLAFGYFPFAVQQIDGHPIYASGWVLVLAAWRLLELIDRPSRRNALWAGAAAAFAMWFTEYFILFAGVEFAALLVVAVIVGRIRGDGRRMLRLGGLAMAPILALFAGLTVFVERTGGASDGGLQVHGINELNAFSARPAEWLLADRRNPVLGHLTSSTLTQHILGRGTNFAEASVYLGVSVMALALIGMAAALRRWRGEGRTALSDVRVTAPLAGGVLALVSAALALPPLLTLGPVKVATPFTVVWMFTTTWRATGRMVEVTELGLCIALAAGAARLLVSRTRWAHMVVFTALVIVVGLDLSARPSTRAVSVTRPPEYAWLAHHPGGTVADYPLRIAAAPHYSPLFWAARDGHAIFQGYPPGPVAMMKYTLRNPTAPHTETRLAALGVRYVVIHPGQHGGSLAQMRRHYYQLRFRGPSGTVYEVPAR